MGARDPQGSRAYQAADRRHPHPRYAPMRTWATFAVLGAAAGVVVAAALLLRSGRPEGGSSSGNAAGHGRGTNMLVQRSDVSGSPFPSTGPAGTAPQLRPFQHSPSPPSASLDAPSRRKEADASADPLEASSARRLLADEAYDDAREIALTCLDQHPGSRSCWDTLLMTYTRTGRFDEARPMLATCLEQDPDDTACMSGMVTQLVRDQDFAHAHLLAERLSSLAPDTTDALLALALVEDASGSADRALELYQAACSNGQEYACKRALQLATP